jgi:hypothetical protein
MEVKTENINDVRNTAAVPNSFIWTGILYKDIRKT